MTYPLSDKIMTMIDQAAELYHRLIIVASSTGTGKTQALRDVSKKIHASLINVNLELSRRMLDLTERQRTLQLPRILSDIVNLAKTDVILLDNIELLFDASLRQDPTRLLQGLSRNKTIVAAWSGSLMGENIVYATPDHPEYMRYPIKDFLVVCQEGTA